MKKRRNRCTFVSAVRKFENHRTPSVVASGQFYSSRRNSLTVTTRQLRSFENKVSRFRRRCSRPSDIFKQASIVLYFLKHFVAILTERESFINIVAQVFEERSPFHSILINDEIERWRTHASMYPLPRSGIRLNLFQCFLTETLHLRNKLRSIPPQRGNSQ